MELRLNSDNHLWWLATAMDGIPSGTKLSTSSLLLFVPHCDLLQQSQSFVPQAGLLKYVRRGLKIMEATVMKKGRCLYVFFL
uniref:Uncharacterized protein n=1 Tax=Setaria italica TaxID=4555 RepID=K4AHF4_SETIT